MTPIIRPLLLACAVAASLPAQPPPTPNAVRAYKRIGADSLVLHIFMPAAGGTNRPAVVLFHGGGFVWGGPEITDGSAVNYAAQGMVAFSVQYRLANRGSITPVEQIGDAIDAVRWIREHANEFGIDPAKLVAHGVSAGGYLAAMAAGWNDPAARPNALVLWSPGVGPGDDPYFEGLMAGRAKGSDYSALRWIHEPMPPMIIISGALDSVTFDANAREYCARATKAGSRCELRTYPGVGHLLTRKLDATSQQRGQFDFDPVASADAEARVATFLRAAGFAGNTPRK